MQVTREALNEMFTNLDMPMAAQWSEKRLLDKVSKLPDVVDEDTDAGPSQPLLDEVLEAVSSGEDIEVTDGGGVEDASKTKPAKKLAAKKPTKKVAEPDPEDKPADDEDEGEEEPEESDAEEADDEEYEDAKDDEEETPKKKPVKKAATKKPAKSAKGTKAEGVSKKPVTKKKPAVSKAGGAGGPGVIASIVEFLTATTAKKPINKDQMVDKLAERFPDRSPDSMMRTINVQVPNRLAKDKGLKVQKNDKGYYLG